MGCNTIIKEIKANYIQKKYIDYNDLKIFTPDETWQKKSLVNSFTLIDSFKAITFKYENSIATSTH